MSAFLCPDCNKPTDNGHDRCYPPNAYICSQCETKKRLLTTLRDEEYEAAPVPSKEEIREALSKISKIKRKK